MSNNYLVTGAMGCIGAWALYQLVQQGKHAVSFDLSDNRSRVDLLLSRKEQESITFVQGDLTDAAGVLKVFHDQTVTHVIHLAALQVPFCRANPVLGSQVNVTGHVNIFEAAKQSGISHVAYASSMAVYGPASDYPPGLLAPDAPMLPRTLYGVYKMADEWIARIYWQDYQLSSTALRPYTVYGIGRDQGVTSDPSKAMRAAARGEAFQIGFGGKMQFHLASDVAKQFIKAAEKPLKGAFGFNLGTPVTAVANVVQMIKDVKPGAAISNADTILPFAEGCDATPLHQHFENVYETPLAEGIQQTIEWFAKLHAENRD
jgi:UDP-glucuronate 4-epimerase